mgnify:CR=1 FL=1
MSSTSPADARAGAVVDLGAPAPTFTEAITIRLRTPAKLRNLELVLLLFAGADHALFEVGHDAGVTAAHEVDEVARYLLVLIRGHPTHTGCGTLADITQ